MNFSMKYVLFLLLALPFLVAAQTEKSINPLPSSPALPAEARSAKAGATLAVVIGISDYQDLQIPDLRFADKDAEAFANFLRSPAGGSLDGDHLQVLTNTQATAGRIAEALDALIEKVQKDDQVIIYFSGHGDVERKTVSQPGFLLAWDAPSRVYMGGGTYSLAFLQEVVTTLSTQNLAKVTVITDACHAGKLAGSQIGGSQLTAASLAKQFSNEVKILSCQPGELSLEGEQWGGGRGIFSYHLVEGLFGLADRNGDGTVSVGEIDRYLEDKVTAEAAPQTQVPMLLGNKSERLATVNAAILADLKKSKAGGLPVFAATEGRGLEEEVLAKLDSGIIKKYFSFKKAVAEKRFFQPENDCAEAFYTSLSGEPGLLPLHGFMKRNYAAALQDEAQIVLNQLLRTDPQIVDVAFSPVSKYDHLPGYLHRAAELLGEKHYMYRFIKAREYYFKAKSCPRENYPALTPNSLFQLALARLDTALTFDEEAAYLYMEKGYWLEMNGDNDTQSLKLYEQAIRLSPRWVLANYFAGRSNGYIHNPDKAITYFKNAIDLDSSFLPTYLALGQSFNKGTKEGNFWFEKYVEKMKEYIRNHPGKVPVTYYNYLGNSLSCLGRWEEAEDALLVGEALSNHSYYRIYSNLGFVYRAMKKYEDSAKAFKKAISLSPLTTSYSVQLGNTYILMGRYSDAEETSQKVISLSPLSSDGYYMYARLKYYYQKKPLAEVIPYFRKAIQYGADSYEDLFLIYLYANQLDSAEALALQFIVESPNDSRARQRLGQLYLLKGMKEQARAQFELMTTLQPNDVIYYAYFPIIAYTQLGKADSLPTLLETERLKANDHPDFYYLAASGFAFNEQNDLALKWLEKAFQKGWNCFLPECDVWQSLESPELYYLRQTPEYKALIARYFPDIYKD